MIKKAFLFLLGMYCIQFMFTACDPCECPTPITNSLVYKKVIVDQWNTNTNELISDSTTMVDKNSFGFYITVGYELTQIAKQIPFFRLNQLGFSQALACDCIFQNNIISDPIKSFKITVTDSINPTERIITHQFRTNYRGEYYQLDDLQLINENKLNRFHVELSNTTGISDTAIFTVSVYLESGLVISSDLHEVSFN